MKPLLGLTSMSEIFPMKSRVLFGCFTWVVEVLSGWGLVALYMCLLVKLVPFQFKLGFHGSCAVTTSQWSSGTAVGVKVAVFV